MNPQQAKTALIQIQNQLVKLIAEKEDDSQLRTEIKRLRRIKEGLKRIVSKNIIAEQQTGTIATGDEAEAERLAKKGLNVKLQTEEEGISLTPEETRGMARVVAKSLVGSLRDQGSELERMKIQNIESNSFDVYVKYKDQNVDNLLSFFTANNKLYMAGENAENEELVDIGIKPSGEVLLNKDVLKNALNKHFKIMREGGEKNTMKEEGSKKEALRQALRDAQEESREGYTVHVNKFGKGDYRLEDWYDSDKTVASFENGRSLHEEAQPEDESAKDVQGNPLLIGDVIEYKSKYFQIRYAPERGKVFLQPVRDVEAKEEYGEPIEGPSNTFASLVSKSAKVTHFADTRGGFTSEGEEDIPPAVPTVVDKIVQSIPDIVGDPGMYIGHQGDEPHMLKKTVYDIATYAAKLYKKLDKYNDLYSEVDFPTWWQLKVILSREYISAAQHYLDVEDKKPALDALTLEAVEKSPRDLEAEKDRETKTGSTNLRIYHIKPGDKNEAEDNGKNSRGNKADLEIYKSELNLLHKVKPKGEKYEKRKKELETLISNLETKSTNESANINPEVVKMVNRFIGGLARKYDYDTQSAVNTIMSVLRSQNWEGVYEKISDEETAAQIKDFEEKESGKYTKNYDSEDHLAEDKKNAQKSKNRRN